MEHFVNVFIGQTRGANWIRRLEELGFGEMVQPAEFPPRRHPFAFDCDRFGMWRRGEQGQPEAEARWAARHEQALDAVWRHNIRPCMLIVPDFVADWARSVPMTLEWLPRVQRLGPCYLSVQDGADLGEVGTLLKAHAFSGVFVGGSLDWKVRTGGAWVALSHALGLKCHIGRVGTVKRVRWASRIGADSIDSCLPLWGEGNLRRFLSGLQPPATMELDLTPAE